MTWLLHLIPLEWLAGALAAIGGIAALWFGGRRSARKDAKVETLKDTVKAHETRNKVDADAGTGDARERLRADWKR